MPKELQDMTVKEVLSCLSNDPGQPFTVRIEKDVDDLAMVTLEIGSMSSLMSTEVNFDLCAPFPPGKITFCEALRSDIEHLARQLNHAKERLAKHEESR